MSLKDALSWSVFLSWYTFFGTGVGCIAFAFCRQRLLAWSRRPVWKPYEVPGLDYRSTLVELRPEPGRPSRRLLLTLEGLPPLFACTASGGVTWLLGTSFLAGCLAGFLCPLLYRMLPRAGSTTSSFGPG